MPTPYVQVSLQLQIHEALIRLRDDMSDQTFQSPGVIGVGAAIQVLIDHYEEHRPELEWIMTRVQAQPRRGRPRKSQPAKHPGQRTISANDNGHVFRRLRAEHCAPELVGRVRICLLCSQRYVDGEFVYDCFVAKGRREKDEPDASFYE